MSVLNGLIILALVATFITLSWGVVSMAQGGKYDEQHSEKLMFTRVGIQAVAFILLLVALVVSVG